MKKSQISLIIFSAFIVIAITLIAVGLNNHSNESNITSHTEENKQSLEKDPFIDADSEKIRAPGSSNYITADVIYPNPENMTLKYNGEPILVTYQFKCEKPCTMGLMIYINGVIQPYKVLSNNKETIMHTIDMNANDTRQFQFEFTPICGEKGEKLTVIFANVYNAKVIDLTSDVNTFGNNHKISQPHPWTLEINEKTKKQSLNISTDFQTRQITSEEKSEFIRNDKNGNTRNLLDDACFLEIKYNNEKITTIDSSLDNELFLYIYGNRTGKYRISFYGDFYQLSLNGYNYIEVDVKKDEYTIIPFTLESLNAKNCKNLFAISAPIEFKNDLQKSQSIYIKN